MSRFKTTVMVLIAVVMLLAAGTPASAETAAGKARAKVGAEVRKQSALPAWWRWIKISLSRYAMAAN